MEQIFTPREFQAYLQNLPKKFQESTGVVQKEMAMSLAQRIRMRAPNGQTGSLKHQIKANLGSKGWQIVGPGHWSFVNAGVAPMKMLPLEFIREHAEYPGSTAGKHLTRKIPKENIDGWFFAGYTEGAGFVDRAMSSFNKDSSKIIERGIMKAFLK
jgi:hypothetical protein